MKRFLAALLISAIALFATLLTKQEARRLYRPRQQESKDALWNQAARRLHKIRANQSTGKINSKLVIEAKKRISSFKANSSGPYHWFELGPDNYGGRTRALIVDQTDSDRLFAGGVSGGLFVSKNRGVSWKQVGNYASLHVSCLAQDEEGTLYVGTGSSFDATAQGGVLFPGSGLYKSTDQGKSLELLIGPNSLNSIEEVWSAVNDIFIDPNNSDVIYVATNGGLRISQDAGETWNSVEIDFTDIPSVGIAIADPRPVGDIEMTGSGRLLCTMRGSVYYSDDPLNGLPFKHLVGKVTDGGELFPYETTSARAVLAAAPSNPMTLYYMAIATNGELEGVYLSQNAGDNWERILSHIDGYFTPMTIEGVSSQGIYDAALTVHPENEDHIYIGGIELWEYDGDLTRIAAEQGEAVSNYYVHSDKHVFAFDPKDSDNLYVGTDGGVFKSMDAGNTWFPANRGFNVAQIYGLAFDQEGSVICGTQDNGTLKIGGVELNSEIAAERINGGDGFDCDYSSLTGIEFATVYQSQIGRRKADENGSFALICGEDLYCGNGPFFTAMRLWESRQDSTSRDSITFLNAPEIQPIGIGNGKNTFFTTTISTRFSQAEIIPGSLQISYGATVLTDNLDAGKFYYQGELIGSFDYSEKRLNINLPQPPIVNQVIQLKFSQRFPNGSQILLESNTPEVLVQVSLPQGLESGQQVVIQDPVQSLLALSTNNGIAIARNALKIQEPVDWWPIEFTGTAETIEFSNDGNHLFVGTTENGLYRISGLNDLYAPIDSSQNGVTITKILDTDRAVNHVAVNPQNSNSLIVCLGNYGNSEFILATESSLAIDSVEFKSIQANLPLMPVYSAIFDVLDTTNILIGTDHGLFTSKHWQSGTPEWLVTNGSMPYVPVFDIRQQTNNHAENYGIIYAGTHGRGVWATGLTLGTQNNVSHRTTERNEESLSLGRAYPNPFLSSIAVDVHAERPTRFRFYVVDNNGKMVYSDTKERKAEVGTSSHYLNMDLEPGQYFLSVGKHGSALKLVKR